MHDLFVSYSHKDTFWLKKLEQALKPVLRNATIWSADNIEVGKKWAAEINEAIAGARVAVLLVSPDFLASDFIMHVELPLLLQRAEQEGMPVIWIPLKHAYFEGTRLTDYQAAWDPERPLKGLSDSDLDQALVDIARKIHQALKESRSIPRTARAMKNGSGSIRVHALELQNLKCFDDLQMTFDGKTNASLVIGTNGRGKSTILQTLALGLLGVARVPFPHAWRDVVKAGQKKGSITIKLEADGRPLTLRYEIYDDALTPVGDPWWDRERFLVLGYGANRHMRLEETKPMPRVESVATLFGENGYLKHPASSRTHAYVADNFASLKTLANQIFSGSGSPVTLEDYNVTNGFLFCTPSNPKHTIPLEALSEGFRSTFTWVLDMSVRLLEREIVPDRAREAGGILLIDEIDLHLHPTWQRTILPGLAATFPRMQIIATTHSPFVVQSLSGTPLTLLTQSGDSVQARTVEGDQGELSYEALAAELFGIDFPFSRETELQFQHFRELKADVLRGERPEQDLKDLAEKLATRGVEMAGIVRRELVDLARMKSGGD